MLVTWLQWLKLWDLRINLASLIVDCEENDVIGLSSLYRFPPRPSLHTYTHKNVFQLTTHLNQEMMYMHTYRGLYRMYLASYSINALGNARKKPFNILFTSSLPASRPIICVKCKICSRQNPTRSSLYQAWHLTPSATFVLASWQIARHCSITPSISKNSSRFWLLDARYQNPLYAAATGESDCGLEQYWRTV